MYFIPWNSVEIGLVFAPPPSTNHISIASMLIIKTVVVMVVKRGDEDSVTWFSEQALELRPQA